MNEPKLLPPYVKRHGHKRSSLISGDFDIPTSIQLGIDFSPIKTDSNSPRTPNKDDYILPHPVIDLDEVYTRHKRTESAPASCAFNFVDKICISSPVRNETVLEEDEDDDSHSINSHLLSKVKSASSTTTSSNPVIPFHSFNSSSNSLPDKTNLARYLSYYQNQLKITNQRNSSRSPIRHSPLKPFKLDPAQYDSQETPFKFESVQYDIPPNFLSNYYKSDTSPLKNEIHQHDRSRSLFTSSENRSMHKKSNSLFNSFHASLRRASVSQEVPIGNPGPAVTVESSPKKTKKRLRWWFKRK